MLRLPYWNRILACIPKSPKGFSENMEIRIWKAFSQLQLSPSLQPREALSQSMIINDNQRQSMTINDNQWCGTSDTSHTANSSDASKASASATRLLSYLLLPLCYIYGKQLYALYTTSSVQKNRLWVKQSLHTVKSFMIKWQSIR